jgi:hypothetical protein
MWNASFMVRMGCACRIVQGTKKENHRVVYVIKCCV